jgi:hypothetical protein
LTFISYLSILDLINEIDGVKPLQHAFRVMFILRELAHDLDLNLYPRSGKGGQTYDFSLQKQLAEVTLDIIAAEEARREEGW